MCYLFVRGPFLLSAYGRGPFHLVLTRLVGIRRLLTKVIVVPDIKLNIVSDFGFNFTLAAELVTIHIYFIDSVQDPEAQVE